MTNGRRLVVLLDMDGTLTRPVLDFAQIRRDMGIEPGRPILEAMAVMSAAARAAAESVLLRHEREAADAAELNDGCHELLRSLAAAGAMTALVTRNSRDSVQRVLRRHELRFGAVVSREDEPHKPHPGAVWRALERLGVAGVGATADSGRVWMVGDGAHDVEAGRAAGVRTVWVSHGRQRDFAVTPDHVAADLFEVRRVILQDG